MRKKQILLAAAVLLLGLAAAGVVLAAGEEITRSVMGGGGQTVQDAGNTYILQGTIAEPVAGNLDTVAGADYHLSSGFWGGGQVAGEGGVSYLPIVLRNF
jgi:hypothetical protein